MRTDKKVSSVMGMLLALAVSAGVAGASELNPLAIKLVQRLAGGYLEPPDRVFVIESLPAYLAFEITNQSQSLQNVRSAPELAYAIELTDASGRTAVLTRKKKLGEDVPDIQKRLPAGERLTVPIVMSSDEWENIPVVSIGQEAKYQARVVYKRAGGKDLYSETYTVIFRLVR